MRLRGPLLLGLIGPLLMVGGCAQSTGTLQPTGPTATQYPDVIDFTGTHGITFGSTRSQLVSAHEVDTTPAAGCAGPQLTGIPYANPVFDHDKLVLIWAYPPLHTPEGVTVGTPLDQVHRLYPRAEALTAPTGSQQYPALLVTGAADRAYLFLYDQGQVQKVIVGFASAARELFRTGFGSC